MPFFAHYHESASIGRLVAAGGEGMASRTASLVGERLALTNAHCVHDHEAPAQPGGAAQLRQARGPGGRRGGRLRVSESVGVTQIHVSPPYQPSLDGRQSTSTAGATGHPGARFAPRRPRPPRGARRRGVPLLAGARVYRGDELLGDRLVVAGYSGDLNEGRLITMDYGCPILGTGAAEYKCATFSGSSGSPILLANGPTG